MQTDSDFPVNPAAVIVAVLNLDMFLSRKQILSDLLHICKFLHMNSSTAIAERYLWVVSLI